MIQFLYVSLGSIAELETQIEISMRLGLLNQDNDLLNKSCANDSDLVSSNNDNDMELISS